MTKPGMRVLAVVVALCVGGSALAQSTGEQGGDSGGEQGSAGTTGDKPKAVDPWTSPDLPKQEPPAAAAVAEVAYPNPYPTAEIDRPFALAPLVLEPRLDILFDFFSGNNQDNFFSTRVGAGFGIIDHLEAGTSFSLSFAPAVKAGDLEFYALYDLSSLLGDFMKLAGRMRMSIPLSDGYSYWYGADFIMLFDAPAKYKIIDMLAAIADVGMGFGLYPGDDVFLLFFDAGVMFQPLEPLAIWWTIGVQVFAGRDATLVPMHLVGQFTLIGDLDLYLDLAFPDLNNAGADWFQMVVGGAFRFGF
jgi:hypothetical protein